MKNDRREEFEKDLLLMMDKDGILPADTYVKARSSSGGYNQHELNNMHTGWCVAKDAEIKRHEQYTASRLALLDANPIMQPYDVINANIVVIEAPSGFKWCVNYVTNNQWPAGATLLDGVKYTLHENSGAPYVDVVLMQTCLVSKKAVYEAGRAIAMLSSAFTIKTSFIYEEENFKHYLNRLTIRHEEFLELQNV